MGRFADTIRSKRFAVTTELTPPKGTDLTDLFGKADLLRDYVDGCNLTESPRARMAIAPGAVAHLLIDRGLDPIVQVTARDRNRIAFQADVLGAAALGIGNFLFMMGDAPAHGDHPEAKAVFDLNSVEMLRAARGLAEGRDLAGNELKGSPKLFLGATVNPGSSNFDVEIANARAKIDAGARFLQTQAVYDVARLRRFIDAVKPDGVAVLAGIIPLKSARMGGWLNANVPGIHVPADLLAEMEAVAGSDAEVRTGIAIAARIIAGVRDVCAGVHLMTMGWETHIPEILRTSGLR
jgi:5,10-methylenetetrahydrofolate reductase